ncbi:TetR/AcrR family transcriptional regulator [Henriciella litoralis]|uniref:TetR/AcrR family transcriptional regulator n=1 Tax=Henriciella litoralis TaxID=568102 RepID=UPI000A005AD6|nr:TetR/AcrR family transcriptional regulator [Henriciella litoralis]
MAENKRRNPKQGRARATVDAILEASLQILETEGEARLTTNHIAEKAGVSIGTLYQYFSDRNDILAELGQRQAETMRNEIAGIVAAAPEQGAIRAIIRTLMQTGETSPTTRALVTDALFRTRGEGVLGTHHLAFMDSVSGQTDLTASLSTEAAFILTHAPISLLRAAAAEPELGLDSDRLEDELVRLMESYLAALSAR